VRQAHLILVTGLPGTGKSRLARALAARYRLPIIAKDTIKEPLLDVIGAADRESSRDLSNASFAVMFSLARACLAAGTDLILEGNFRPGEHESAIEALDARIAQILCRASESVRLARLRARATDPTRHKGHRDAELAAGDPLIAGASIALDFLALPGERLVFDSDARSAAEVDPSGLQRLFDTLRHWHDRLPDC
jgi:predicted kinase